jgi:hypothetical protein
MDCKAPEPLRTRPTILLGIKKAVMVRRRKPSPDTAMLLEIVKVLRTVPRYAAAARRIDAIEQRYVRAAGEQERLGLRRSAARMAFFAATDKGASFEAVAKRFRARCSLGFDDVFSELAVLVEFGYACAEFGKRKTGLRALGLAQQRLEGSGVKPAAYVHQSGFIEQCHRRLEGGEPRRASGTQEPSRD